MFKNDTIVLVDSQKGVVKSVGTITSRGRELIEREFGDDERHNHHTRLKVFYVTISGDIVVLRWRKGNLGDIFLDSSLLPASARVPVSYREKVEMLP